jgi:hypothetical protein
MFGSRLSFVFAGLLRRVLLCLSYIFLESEKWSALGWGWDREREGYKEEILCVG